MKHKIWFKIYLVNEKGGIRNLMATVRSKGLAYATYEAYVKIYHANGTLAYGEWVTEGRNPETWYLVME
mgnify:CR=1 FL=1